MLTKEKTCTTKRFVALLLTCMMVLTMLPISQAWADEGDPQAAAPVFTPEAGEVQSGTEIILSTEAEDSSIFYTLNGEDPTDDGQYPTDGALVYGEDGPIIITEDTTVKAFVIASWHSPSAIAEAVYTIAEEATDDTIVVATPAELLAVATAVNSGEDTFADKTVELAGDIDLTTDPATAVWTPIGTSASAFQGIFDGNGHTINIEDAATPGNRGIFGYINNATIRNLTIDGTVVSIDGAVSSNRAAGIVANTSGETLIENCINNATVGATGRINIAGIVANTSGTTTINNCINRGAITVNQYGAGIVAYATGTTTITNCINEGIINGTSQSIGGIAYQASGNITIAGCTNKGAVGAPAKTAGILVDLSSSGTALIEDCVNEAPITSTMTMEAGGIISKNNGTMTISNCTNNSIVSAPSNYASGIAAWNSGTMTITNSDNSGSISGTAEVGGLVGAHDGPSLIITNSLNRGPVIASGSTPSNTGSGGLVGFVRGNIVIENSYNSAPVSLDATSDYAGAGGIVGVLQRAEVATIKNVYNTGTITGLGGAFFGFVGGSTAARSVGNLTLDGYYLEGTAEAPYVLSSLQSEVTATYEELSAEYMQSAAFVEDLNGESGTVFSLDTNNINKGFPILSFQSEYVNSGVVVNFDVVERYAALGGDEPSSQYFLPGQPYGTLPVPILEGYDFAGWHHESELVTEESIVPDVPHALAAHWEGPLPGFIAGTCTITESGTYKLLQGITGGTVTIEPGLDVKLVGTGYNSTRGDQTQNMRFDIGEGSTITIEDAFLENSPLNFNGSGNTLLLSKTNLLETSGTAAIRVNQGTELDLGEVVEGGTLYLYKNTMAAGIGSNTNETSGIIRFLGGNYFLKGTRTGPTVGGDVGTAGDIHILGGIINIETNANGAGIGGSNQSSGGNVYLVGGTLSIVTDWAGSAIGRGASGGAGGNLYVSGGTLRTSASANSTWPTGVGDANITANKLDANGNPVARLVFNTTLLETPASVFDVKVNDQDFYLGGLHTYEYTSSTTNTLQNWVASDDSNLYFYLTLGDHILSVNDELFIISWSEDLGNFDVEPYTEPEEPKVGAPGSGDFDGDGYVTIADAMSVAQVVMSGTELTPAQLAAIDLDEDGIITIADALRIVALSLA